MADKKFNLKDQLAGIAALIAAIVAIGGGFVKYGEITTKLDALAGASKSIDMSFLSEIKVLEEKVSKLENTDTSHTHDFIEHNHPVDHNHTKSLVNEKQIELLKVQIEEIKISTSNPLTNN